MRVLLLVQRRMFFAERSGNPQWGPLTLGVGESEKGIVACCLLETIKSTGLRYPDSDAGSVTKDENPLRICRHDGHVLPGTRQKAIQSKPKARVV